MRPTRYPSRARALLCEGNFSSCFRSYSVTRAHVLLAAALRLARFCCGPSLEFSDSLHIAWLPTVYQAIRAKADILFEPLPQLPSVSFLLPVSLFGDRVFVPCDWLALQGVPHAQPAGTSGDPSPSKGMLAALVGGCFSTANVFLQKCY